MLKDIKQTKKEFIYLPHLNLYFSKKRFSFGNWHRSHEMLQKQESRMSTLSEFLEFSKYLKSSANGEYQNIYKEIFERGYFRGEWLDATFNTKGQELSIGYNNILKDGNLTSKNSEVLDENTLMTDLKPGISLDDWIQNPTKQGLPKKDCKKGKIYYWHPRAYKNAVVRFVSNTAWVYLSCGANPSNFDTRVRIVKNPDSF